MRYVSGLSIQKIARLTAASISVVQVGLGIPFMPESLHRLFEASLVCNLAHAILQRSWHNIKIMHCGLSAQNIARSQDLHFSDQGTRAISPEYYSVRLHPCKAPPGCRSGTCVPRSGSIYTVPIGAEIRCRRRLLVGSQGVLPGRLRQRKLRHGRTGKLRDSSVHKNGMGW